MNLPNDTSDCHQKRLQKNRLELNFIQPSPPIFLRGMLSPAVLLGRRSSRCANVRLNLEAPGLAALRHPAPSSLGQRKLRL